MEYDSIYHAHCSLSLQSGRQLVLDRIIQARTYAGSLMGTPDQRANDDAIARLMRRARQDPDTQGEPYLIPPARRDYFRQPGDMQALLDRQRQENPSEIRCVPEWLPMIECIGFFHSLRPVHDPAQDGSCLTVVWYQDDFGFKRNAVEHLQAIDWDGHAVDFSF